MILHYTKKYLTSMMEKDKVLTDDEESIRNWFDKSHLGNRFFITHVFDNGHTVKLTVESKK